MLRRTSDSLRHPHVSELIVMSKIKAPQTVAAANGIAADKAFGAITPPLYLSSTFAFAGFEQSGDRVYAH